MAMGASSSSVSSTSSCIHGFTSEASGASLGDEQTMTMGASSSSSSTASCSHTGVASEASSVDEKTRTMDPRDIRYTQTRLSPQFSARILSSSSSSKMTTYSEALMSAIHGKGLLLRTLLSDLRAGRIDVQSVDPIRVFLHNNVYYSLDNRRLWVFKQLGLPSIPVRLSTNLDEFLQKFQQDGDNLSATLLPDPVIATDDVPGCKAKAGDKQERLLLIHHVLQWSINDIMDDNFMAPKVKPIPRQFKSLEKYLDSFRWPLLEEVRAEIKKSLEVIEEAPYAPLGQIYEADDRHRRKDPNRDKFKKFAVYVDEENLKIFPQKNDKRHQFRPKDLVFLSSKLPSSVEELGHSKGWNIMALIEQVVCEDQEEEDISEPSESWHLRVLMKKSDAIAAHQDLLHPSQKWYIIYLSGLATSSRIWNALHPSEDENPTIAQKILSYETDEFQLEDDDNPSISQLKQEIETYCSNCSLNESQINAVTTILCDIKNGLHPGVRMIQGPPGTGKTSTIVSLLSVASSIGMKCLIMAPTNIAVAGVAIRYMEMIKSHSNPQFGEFCNQAAFSQEICKVLQKADIVLVGNEERLPVQSCILEEIYLPYRVKRIRKAFKSWREGAYNLCALLDSCDAAYEAYQERMKQKGPLNLLEFTRNKLLELVRQLTQHCSTLKDELPSGQAEMFSQYLHFSSLLLDCILEPGIPPPDFSQWLTNNESRMDLIKQLRKWQQSGQNLLFSKQAIEELCMSSSSIVFCTVSMAGSFHMRQAPSFDCAIMDEAAQLVEAESAIVTCSSALKHVVLVGDHQQLPATVISQVAAEHAYGRSLFERMMNLGYPCHLLNTQYRMHPSISLFPNANFYQGRLIDGENVKSPPYAVYGKLLFGSYAFLDIVDGVEQNGDEEETKRKSKKNVAEAVVVMSMSKRLSEVVVKSNIHSLTVGVITPYSSQRDLLRSYLEKQKVEPLIVDVNSVDGFQGQEKDIIILSTVRANKSGDIGFLKDYRRLNVAITRARYCLWIVGNKRTLTSKENVWRELLQDAITRQLFRNAADDPKLGKLIFKAKHDLNEFLDLHTDSALFSNMLWKVLFSNDFKNSLVQLKSVEKRKRVLQKIQFLSSGHHSSRYKKKLEPAMAQTDGLIEIHIVANLCLIWSIDVERDGTVKQIIKLWNMVSFSDLPKYMKRLDAAFQVYSPQYIERCKIRRLSSDKKLTLPAEWEDDRDFVWLKPHRRGFAVESNIPCQPSRGDDKNLERSSVNESLLLMKFYSLSSGNAKQLLTAQDGLELNLPFEVNKEETIIIQHPSSCFVLGRSGTGKTTVLVTKLIQREQQYKISLHGLENNNSFQREVKEQSVESQKYLRQILVTLSPVLCSAIKQHIDQIKRSMSQAVESMSHQDSPACDFNLILDSEDENRMLGFLPDSLADVPSTSYPMVLTFQKFLMMLDNSVKCPFFKNKPHRGLQERIGKENSCITAYGSPSASSKDIDFDHFDSEYWPHLNSSLTKNLDSSTVFTEIMSVIKGSIQAVKSRDGILNKASYVSYATSTKENKFDATKRENIYSLFLQYEKLKREAQSYDIADQVGHLYKQLCHGTYFGDQIDFIYIDEVQDFTEAQLSLFSFVSSNIKDGFVFAGDTAQVITRGVDFRFQDVRRLFYTDFAKATDHIEHSMECVSDKKKSTKCTQEFAPTFFQLKHNFRTHMGVVNIANSIVELLYNFFPQSIDKLDQETSIVHGEPPVFLKAQGQELVTMVFGSRGDRQREGHDFGAHQVILVRDEDQKKRLVDRIGLKGLVLTINGCKGLEFQDVLIYNFFSGSLLQNKWRVIYEYIYQSKAGQTDTLKMESHPSFDPNKHNLLCSELKHLYVAVTRARQRLWIYEENDEFCKPMLHYWMHSELVETKLLDASLISMMAASSTSEDWKKKGFELFNRGQYDMATLCFERAGDEHHTKLATAANHQQAGEKQLVTNRKAAIASLREAARLFLSLGRAEMAAKCFIKVGDFQKAGFTYLQNCKPPKFEDAGDCFREAKNWIEAAKVFFKGRCLRKCLDACFLGEHLEMGLSFIRKWEDKHVSHNTEAGQEPTRIDKEIKNEYLQDCAILFHQRHNVANMMMFVNMFSDMTLKRTFLKTREYIDELMGIEEAEMNYLEAAELAQMKGDFNHMVELLRKAGDYNNAVKAMLFLVRKDVLWAAGNRGWGFRNSARPTRLLQKVKELSQLAANSVSHEAQIEINLMFAELTGPQSFKKAMEQVKCHTQSDIKIRLFATWNAISAPLSISKDCKQDVVKFQETNTLLAEFINTWHEWRNIILKCKAFHGIRHTCYEFFAVTHDEATDTCIVHECEAYWLQCTKQGGSPVRRLSVQEFAILAARFWDEQLHENDDRLMRLCTVNLGNQLRSLKSFRSIRIVEKTKLLLELAELSNMPCSFKGLEAFIKDLHEELLLLLWPPSRNLVDMCQIQQLREDTRIVRMLDQIGDMLISRGNQPCTQKETSQLLLTSPFLSEVWKNKCLSSLAAKLSFWKSDIVWSCDRLKSDAEFCIGNFIVQFANPLIQMFHMEDWENVEGYITLSVFVTLLEKATMMACACNTLLHRMYLPLTLALDFMCEKGQKCLLQKLLNYEGSSSRENESTLPLRKTTLYLLTKSIIDILLKLLSQPNDIKAWLAKDQMEMHVSAITLRLLMLLFVVCVNSRQLFLHKDVLTELHNGILQKDPLTELHKDILTKLDTNTLDELHIHLLTELHRIFMNHNHPVHRHLPAIFRSKCQKAFWAIWQRGAGVNESVRHLKQLLANALPSMGDALVMTVRCENEMCCQLENGIKAVDLRSNGDIFWKVAALAGVGSLCQGVVSCNTQNDLRPRDHSVQEHGVHQLMELDSEDLSTKRAQDVHKSSKGKVVYNTHFPDKVSDLEESAHGHLDKHDVVTMDVKSEDVSDLLDAPNDIRETLQQEMASLNPSHEEHTRDLVGWPEKLVKSGTLEDGADHSCDDGHRGSIEAGRGECCEGTGSNTKGADDICNDDHMENTEAGKGDCSGAASNSKGGGPKPKGGNKKQSNSKSMPKGNKNPAGSNSSKPKGKNRKKNKGG